MNILAFDTSLGACSAALTRAGREGVPPRSASRFERMEKGHAERLIPMIGEVLDELQLGMGDIDRIVVTRGPGTFTGVRIGVAAARALALATGAKLASVSSLHLLASEAASRLGGDADVAVAVDARRDEIYFQLFGGGRLPLTDPLLVSPSHAASLVRDRETVVAGSGASLVREAARARGRELTAAFLDLEPDARYMPELDAEDCDGELRPLYLRAPDAKPPAAPSLARAQ